MASAYDDELTPEEKALLENDNTPPIADDNTPAPSATEGGDPPAPDPAQPPAADPNAPPSPDPAAPADGAPPVEDDAKDMAAFLERHKGKTPDELLKLAFQQQKRATKGEFQARNAADTVKQLADRARQAREAAAAAAANAETRKQAFRDKLASDPDAATAELHDQRVDAEVSEAERAAEAAAYEEAVVFAVQHIPGFGEQWPEIHGVANELGFSDAELDTVNDGRHLIALTLATYAARAMKAGLMDNRGQLNLPRPGDPTPDPRLNAPTPVPSIGQQRGVSGGGTLTAEQELARLASLPDDEFNKLDPKIIDALLRQSM